METVNSKTNKVRAVSENSEGAYLSSFRSKREKEAAAQLFQTKLDYEVHKQELQLEVWINEKTNTRHHAYKFFLQVEEFTLGFVAYNPEYPEDLFFDNLEPGEGVVNLNSSEELGAAIKKNVRKALKKKFLWFFHPQKYKVLKSFIDETS